MLKKMTAAPLLLWSTKLLLILTLISLLSFQLCQTHAAGFPSPDVPFPNVMYSAGRKVAVWALEAVPGWWALKSTELSAECTLKDVKYSPLLCCSFFFFF